jgi:hypothetical protein
MKDVLLASILLGGAELYLLNQNLAYLGVWLLLVTIVLGYGVRIPYTASVLLAIATVLAVIMVSGRREGFEDEEPQSDTTNDPEPHIDMGSTIISAYKRMKPEQVQQMREDTKELMETQKQLIETLGMLGPQVQQGAELMKTFKGMFGGNIADVMKQ